MVSIIGSSCSLLHPAENFLAISRVGYIKEVQDRSLTKAGWLIICGWQAVLAGAGYLTGTMMVALIQLNHTEYVPKLWHGTLLFWAVVIIAVFVNTITARILPKIELFMLVVHLVGFLAVLIPIVSVSLEAYFQY